MNRPLTAALLTALLAGTTLAQVTTTTTTTTVTTPVVISDDHAVITPQARRHVWSRRHADPVRLDAVAVTGSVSEQVALTEIELTLFNPSSTPQQAVVLLPVPAGASVRSLQYDGTGPEPTAKVMPRDEARRIYDSIVNSMRDPALLEFAGYGVLRTSAFPVPANTAQKVRITLEQVLTAESGQLDWVLPRTEMLAGTSIPWTFKGSVKSAEPIASVFSASHDVKIERTGPGSFDVTADAKALRAAGSLRLAILKANANPAEPVHSVAAYADPSSGGGFFNLIVSLPVPPQRETLKRDLTLVLDRSGSMRGEKFKQALAAAENVLAGLSDGEKFNIIDYSDSIATFAAAPVIKDADSLKRATAYLKSLAPTGGTNIHDALVEAIRPPSGGFAASELPLVLFLTDGLPTVGERSEAKIRQAVAAANTGSKRVFTFGVGFDVNTPLLNAVSRSTRATATYVTPDENTEVKVSQLFKRLSGPVLASPKVTFIDTATGAVSTTIVRDLQPGAADVPDVFEGEQVMLTGAYTSGQKFKVRIEGNYLGKPHTFEYEVDPSKASAQNAYVSRLWASKRIGTLVDLLRTEYAEKQIDPKTDPRARELIDEVVALSTRFGILTEYTAFLATEPQTALRDADALRGMTAGNVDSVVRTRSGADAMKQEAKSLELREMPAAAPGAGGGNAVQYWYEVDRAGRGLVRRDATNVNQVQDRTFFNRNNRWVDGSLITKEAEQPERTVVIGTAEYTALAEELLAANLSGLLALDGDVYFAWKGQRVLMQNAAPQNPQGEPAKP